MAIAFAVPPQKKALAVQSTQKMTAMEVHFAIPEGTASITQLNGEGHDSWRAWGVDKAQVTSVTIPSSVKSIGIEAFKGFNSLRNVNIPRSVTSIGTRAFEGCSSLATFTVAPSAATSFGLDVFDGCDSFSGYVQNLATNIPTQEDVATDPEEQLFKKHVLELASQVNKTNRLVAGFPLAAAFVAAVAGSSCIPMH